MRYTSVILSAALLAPALTFAQSEAPTVAVMNFTGGSMTPRPGDYAALGRGISELLTNALASNPNIRLADRARLSDLLAEQRLAASGQVDPETAVRLGKVLGVRHFVTGGFLIDPKNRMRFDVRSVNVETSEIEFRETIEGKVDDLFDLIDRMDRKLTAAVGVAFAPQQQGAARPSTKNAQRWVDSLTAKKP
ncbi:MAG TPA: CsgG/HfaB family protein [Gemmatimonadaceae bacterium]|nr:CsgG/HfaB family protein [Gemmatimonadaceae bacterium]